MERVAWLGTGMLGSGFVLRLREQGVAVDVWNRTPDKLTPLVAAGAVAHPSIAAAVAHATRVHLCLSDDDAVDGVLVEVAKAIPKDALVVDHTTVAPQPTARRAERAHQQGLAFVHAPVFMAPENARQGTGIMLASAPQALFARAEPALKTMTGKLLYLGERPDQAAAFKLFGNCMILAMASGMNDLFVLARATGIDPVEALTLFKDFPVGRQIEGRGARMARGDFEPSFELSMARKDVRLMLETARAAPDAALIMLPAMAERMDELLAQGLGAKDMGVIARDVFGAVVQTGRRREP